MNGPHKILVACDFEDSKEIVVRTASSLAEKYQAELCLLHVLSKKEQNGHSQETIRHAKERLERLLPPEQVMNLSCRWEVCEGSAAKQITRYAEENNVDLIVLGARDRVGFSRLMGHNVAGDVLKTAPCAVMVVPHQCPQTDLNAEHQQAEPLLEQTIATTPALDLLQRAQSLRATDIHIDPASAGQYGVRLRIDGRLEHYCDLDGDLAVPLLQQFKVLADLDIAEPFRIHEGRLRLPHVNWDRQVRITTSPVAGGESVCLRLQTRDTMFRPLGDLGLTDDTQAEIQAMLRRGEGIVLVTGPTGAGKTTTVYSMLRELESGERHRNLVTIEDPVEFNVPFLRQMSIDEAHGITLNAALRTMLRMDPDVVFVGEIRDVQTAEMAMRAASSGKYVFSTLHTRDVTSTVTALRDLGVSPRSLAGNLTGIISQRLVRRLCPHCRELGTLTNLARQLLAEQDVEMPSQLYEARGCDHCRGTGYRGRVGVFEVVVATSEFVEAMDRGAPEDELRRLIRAAGTPSLTAAGLQKAIDGITSIDEVLQMRWM